MAPSRTSTSTPQSVCSDTRSSSCYATPGCSTRGASSCSSRGNTPASPRGETHIGPTGRKTLFGDLRLPVTFLLTSFYWDNFIHFGMGPKKGADGTLAITLPMGDAKLPAIAAEDIGKCAYGVFKRGREHIGTTVGIAGEQLTGAEMAAAFTKALGQKVVYNDVPPEVFRGFGFPGADDLGNMFQFKRDFNRDFCAPQKPDLARALNPELQTFDAWLAHNKSRVPLE